MTTPSTFELDDDTVIHYACEVLERRLTYRANRDASISRPDDANTLVELRLAERVQEVFAVLFLDNRHRLIAFEELFYGSVDGATVYPREVVRRSLVHNAAAVILAHNHPSGVSDPSRADQQITGRLKEVLAVIDVRVLDHLVVGDEVISMAERGLI